MADRADEVRVTRTNGASEPIIGKDDYYLEIAQTVARRSNCVGRQVGAVMVRDDRIVSTGYNGTPEGMANCRQGGCIRCSDRESFPSGTNYDLCICVHAEANAIATAARFGIALDGATLYTTDQPCFSCAKELIQVTVKRVLYIKEWKPNPTVEKDYRQLQAKLRAEQRQAPKEDGKPQPVDSICVHTAINVGG